MLDANYYRARIVELRKEEEVWLFTLEKAMQEKKTFVELIVQKLADVINALNFAEEQLVEALKNEG